MTKYSTETIIEKVDCETGEVKQLTSTKTFTVKSNNTDEFYMTFVDYMAPFFKLKSVRSIRVLAWLCSHVTYNEGTILLATGVRQQLCEELNISQNNLTNTLKELKELNLISGEKGIFTINPCIFWKGTINERNNKLQADELSVSFKATFKDSQD